MKNTFPLLPAAVALLLSMIDLSCWYGGAPSGGPAHATSSGGSVGGTGSGGATTGTGSGGAMDGFFADFPAGPVVASDDLPADIGTLFDSAPGSGEAAPCLHEPSDQAMVPANWTPLFHEWTAAPELNVFELRATVDNQINPLVVYTSSSSYTIDSTLWGNLIHHSSGRTILIALRGARLEGGVLTVGPTSSASAEVFLARVSAPGSIVYAKSRGGILFSGFTIGDIAAKTVLTPAAVGSTVTGSSTSCISCHASSPDGNLFFYSRWADDDTLAVDVRSLSGGIPPPDIVSPSARALLGRHKQTMPVLSPAHYTPGDAVTISVFYETEPPGYELIWTDLHAIDLNSWGVLARNGDTRGVSSPAWRHDGTAIAYVSSPGVTDGVIAGPAFNDYTMDIYTVPYNNRAGGDAKPLPGASDPKLCEFYPAYSAGDTLLAFNRTDQMVSSYDEPSAEIFVVPGSGGSPVRLRANDPPACTGLASPGVTNSWPRWAPETVKTGDRTYYWVVFSSRRRLASSAAGGLLQQLYVATLVTRLENGVEVLEANYPPLYVTAQNPDEDNVTPVWGPFAF